MYALRIQTLQGWHTLYFESEYDRDEFMQDASLMHAINIYRLPSGEEIHN